MIATDINGCKVYLATAAIATITEAGISSQWHGVRAFIKTFDGRTIECRETLEQITAKLEGADTACNFPAGTCAASRDAQHIGEALLRGSWSLITGADARTCGESILSTVASLRKARTRIAELEAEAIRSDKAL